MFSQIAESFAPFRQVTSCAPSRNDQTILWHRLPPTKTLLDGEPIASLPRSPHTRNSSQTDHALADAIQTLNENLRLASLLDEQQQLWRTFDRGDLYQIVARIAHYPRGSEGIRPFARSANCCSAGPCMCPSTIPSPQPPLRLLEHRISWLPVVQSDNKFGRL